MDNAVWVIVDTETDGLYEPIHVVEISGQLMHGWEPVGEPFQIFLNHDVEIPADAEAVHGYTREFLREHGVLPRAAHEAFRAYAMDAPLVAHNLSFDWNRCLEPEWKRLGIPTIGQRGLCSMLLARRLVTETSSYRLEALKQCFGLTPTRSHHAAADVLTVVELFQKVFQPRLLSAGIADFASVAEFSKRTPVAKCLSLIQGIPQPQKPKDEWYVADESRVAHGPFAAWEAWEKANFSEAFIWREGMAEWKVNTSVKDFLKLRDKQRPKSRVRVEIPKSMSELIGLCRGIIADDHIKTSEVVALSEWLQDAGVIYEWPASEIAQTVERILEDGEVTWREKEELKALLLHILR